MPDTDNRRQTPRLRVQHDVCLQADISLLGAEDAPPRQEEAPLTIFGSTHDLSTAGLSLIVPYMTISHKYCHEEDHTLPLTLYLPTGESVNMEISPVRCIPLDRDEPGEGFFMGAEIRVMDQGERKRFIKYLRSLPDSAAREP